MLVCLTLSLRYQFCTQKIVITSLFYEQKVMIPIIIPVAHRTYFPVLSDLCRTSKSSFSCCRVDHLGWPRKNAVPSRSLLGDSLGHPHVPKQRVEGNSTKASEAYLCRERTLKNALFDKRSFEYEQSQTDKRLQMEAAQRRRKTKAWTITENVTSKMAAVTSRTQVQRSTSSPFPMAAKLGIQSK